MKLHFENLSFGIILFYAIVDILLVGTWLLILKNILKYFLKRELNIKLPFIVLSVILFVFFMIATLLDHSYESTH
jgi:hypothetical protein